MGSAYDFNLLMYFLALCIGTRCLLVISFWVCPLYSQRWKSWQLYTCLPSLRPFVSPLSPLCLPYSPFVSSSLSLLLPAVAAWLGFLFCSTAESSWVLLFWKECESVWLPKNLSGDLGSQSPKIWFRTSFVPRSDLVKIAASQNPARSGFGKALQWSAAWFAAAAAAAVVVACAGASGQGAVFGQRSKRFVKGLKLCRRCACVDKRPHGV